MVVKEDKILFDPGYAPLVMDYLGQVGYCHYMFSAVKDVKTKRLNFPMVFQKIQKLLKKNVAFYLGCLLWASYIAQFDKDIVGNQLLGDDATEAEYTSEINFLIDFIEVQLPRDTKYYLNKHYEADERYLPILKAYKEFLILNKGFINCSKTSHIVLPKELKKLSDDSYKKVYEIIQNTIDKKDIELIFDGYSELF